MSPTPEEYAQLVLEARNREYPASVQRADIVGEIPAPAPFNTVSIITGIRRCGKTFYAFQLIRRLISQGTDPDRIFYFDFSDDRLMPIADTLLDDVVNEYWRQVPEARSEGCYLFLDEIQDAPNWQGFCRRIAEHERVTLVITGSSSKLSSDEIATNFRGRSLEYPMMPLSFREYCEFRSMDVPRSSELARVGSVAPALQTELEAAYSDYLVTGGFPGVQRLAEPERIRTLQTYARDIVARDVAERAGRTDIALANQISLFGLRNTGCDLSVNGLAEHLRSVGFKTTWGSVSQLVRLFEQAHLLEFLPEYATALSPATNAMQKVYGEDPGLVHAVSRANQQDIGKRFETAVYLELRRRLFGSRIETLTSYTAPTAKREKIDFLVGDALSPEPYALIQATVTMAHEKTRKREISSLEKAMELTGVAQGTIVSLREQETVETKAGVIHVVPAWLWTLSK